ncbi:MAG: PASTA domain-containing protein [Ruminococcaceae bacterium]|nr:PASTA domain-containing protein [Oscillospiraceae bacterium]
MSADKYTLQRLCMNCFEEKGDVRTCPYCGYADGAAQGTWHLPLRAIIANRYAVGRFLGANGDGATYLGYDVRSESPIIIREFLPVNLIDRAPDYSIRPQVQYAQSFAACKEEFLNLWRGIARMRELTGVMTIYDITEDFGTVYVISEYIETITFRDYLDAQPSGRLPWEEVKRLFMPLLSTLSELHKAGIVHGCISPNSLRICKDGRVRLFQFSIPEVRTVGEVLPTAISPGFAALEQYSASETIGPWSDVYSFSALIYRSLTGNTLPEAPQRINDETIAIPDEVRQNTPEYVFEALWRGLRVNSKLRTRSLESLQNQLNGVREKIAEAVDTEEEEALPPPEPPKKSHGGLIAFLIILVILAAAAALALTVFREQTFSLLGITSSTPAAEHTTSEEMVTVPNFVTSNMTKEQIKNNVIWNEDFYIVFEEKTDLNADINHICSQSVPAGESVNKGTQIILDVCIGRPDVELPNVTEMREADAVKTLEKLGFTVSVVYVDNDGTKPKGVVSQMSKDAGVTYTYGTEVVLSVYAEVKPTTTQPETTTLKQ